MCRCKIEGVRIWEVRFRVAPYLNLYNYKHYIGTFILYIKHDKINWRRNNYVELALGKCLRADSQHPPPRAYDVSVFAWGVRFRRPNFNNFSILDRVHLYTYNHFLC